MYSSHWSMNDTPHERRRLPACGLMLSSISPSSCCTRHLLCRLCSSTRSICKCNSSRSDEEEMEPKWWSGWQRREWRRMQRRRPQPRAPRAGGRSRASASSARGRPPARTAASPRPPCAAARRASPGSPTRAQDTRIRARASHLLATRTHSPHHEDNGGTKNQHYVQLQYFEGRQTPRTIT